MDKNDTDIAMKKDKTIGTDTLNIMNRNFREKNK